MNTPKKIKIGGMIWEIIQNEHVANEGNCFGSTHFRKQKIFIDPDETQQKKEETLIHEILHVIYWQTGLIERNKKEAEKLSEEEIILAFSGGLYQVLKDNNLLK